MTIAVTAIPEPSTDPTDPPRVRIQVAANAGETRATVVRRDPDGSFVPVRTEDGGPLSLSGGMGIAFDYEMPYGLGVGYTTVESPSLTSAVVTVNESVPWLVHPGVPVLSRPVDLHAESFAEEQWAVEQGVFWPMGRERPVVQTDGARKAAASSLTVRIHDADALRALRLLLSDASPLLLNVPPQLNIGVDTCYIAVGGVQNRRPVNIGDNPLRHVVLPFQVVDRPVGGAQAERTYGDVLADNTSYNQLLAKYPTYLALQAGP